MKLTDTMLIILTEAAKRSDRVVIPPERLKGAAADKVIGKLLAGGLVADVRAARGMPEWKRGEDGPRALILTDEGLKAIGADPGEGDPSGSNEGERPAQPPGKKPAGRSAKSSPRPAEVAGKKQSRRVGAGGEALSVGSKTAQLIRLLQKPGGVTIETLAGTLSWLPHTTRAALTGLRKRGFTIERSKTKDGPSAYRITGEPPALASGPTRRATSAG